MLRKGKSITKPQNLFSFFWQELKLGESYSSLILGIIVVVFVTILAVSFVKSKNTGSSAPTTEVSSQSTQKIDEQGAVSSSTYAVVSGDTLWSIAEKYYKSGYNWVDIAKENKLEDPSLLSVGLKLAIPKLEAKILTAQNLTQAPPSQEKISSITGSSYTIQKDDNLWDIAVRAYGDGFKWVDIARENNLENPDLIFSGNVLKIPR